MNTQKNESIPERKDIPEEDKWDLSKLFSNDSEWETGLREFEALIPEIEKFKGSLGKSAENLRLCLDFMNKFRLLEEKLEYYAYLHVSENVGDSDNQGRMARFMSSASKAEALSSYQIPEIQAIPNATINIFLENKSLEPFQIYLKKILRFKPHILSEAEETLLALQAESNQTASKTFSALTDVDMEFGTIKTDDGEKPLTQSTFSSFLINPDKEIRKKAYLQFYEGFKNHENTIASLYAGSVHLDIYKAKVRKHASARAASLFPDKVPESVYDNLVKTVNNNLDSLHSYYDLRRRVLGLDKLHHYDVYVPIIKDIKVQHKYEEAVDVVISSLSILGDEYCSILKEGLLGRWVDRYENKGKRSGAFSAGSYTGDPYILMNFKEDVLRDVFTLAHEGGHSMHSHYSAANNPFQHYNYTIFEAEVASTFNEQFLAKYLKEKAESDAMTTYLLGKQIDDIIATIFRQTMFAEFEDITHSMVENGSPLTVAALKSEYRKLLDKYFGPDVILEDVSSLEGLRIPHFYRAFYVYKYSTGLSAAIALSKRVMNGGEKEKNDYLNFLKSGGSAFPLESLKLAGVDMSTLEPVQEAMTLFRTLLQELEKLIDK